MPDVRLGELEVPLRMADDLLGGAHRGRVPAGPPPAVSPRRPHLPFSGPGPRANLRGPRKCGDCEADDPGLRSVLYPQVRAM